MSRTTMTRRILTGVATASLALGLAACTPNASDDDEGDDSPEQTGTALTTPEGADTESPRAEATVTDTTAGRPDNEDVETQEIELLDGGTADVPTELAEAVETRSTDFGQALEVEQGNDGEFLVTFDQGNYLAYSEDTGAQPMGGQIAETWLAEEGLRSDLGLPTGPEEIAEDEGRTQEFTGGTITVGPDGTAEVE